MAKNFLEKALRFIGRSVLIASLLNGVLAPQAIAQTSYLDRFNGAIIAAIGKAPVDVATTANITLSGYKTIDTVSVNADYMRVLVKNQTDQTKNGIYTVFSGTWVRSSDFAGPSGTVSGQLIIVNGGTQAGIWRVSTPNPIQIDNAGGQTTSASNITFQTNPFTVLYTGSPVSGNLGCFSSSTSLTNCNLSGDVSTSGAGVTTLATVNGNIGSFGSGTAIPNFTVNGKGLLTAAGSTALSVAESSLNLADNTTADVSISKHGFAPKSPNDVTKFLNGLGAYSSPVVQFLVGTSTSSLSIATGSKTFTTQSGLTLSAGQFLLITSNADATNFMHGQVTSYSGTTLVVNVLDVGGSGTLADWNINVSGPQGAQGAGNINSGTAGQLTWYAGTGTTVSGNANATMSSGALTLGVATSAQGSLKLSGSTSGTTTIAAPVSGGGTMTLQAGSDTIVGRATTDTLTNKTLTAPVISSISNSGTITVPTGTDTLVGRATTDTLTNKTLTAPTITSPNIDALTVSGAVSFTALNKTGAPVSFTLTTAFGDIPGMSWTLTPGNYNIRTTGFVSQAAAGGFKLQGVFSGTAPAYNVVPNVYNGSALVTGPIGATLSSSFVSSTTGTSNYYDVDHFINVSVTGTFKLQGSQQASNGTSTTFTSTMGVVTQLY